MDAVIVTAVTAAVSAVAGAGATIARAWIKARGRQRATEESGRDRLSDLPLGSRVIDFGDHGMVIEVGGRNGQPHKDHHAGR
jgi:hypothetical protein